MNFVRHKPNKKKDLKRLQKYLRNSGYEQTFVYLTHAQMKLRAREFLQSETINNLRNRMKIRIASKEEDRSRRILESQALQFDLIAKIFMSIEDLFYFINFLSTNPKKLPSDMVKQQFVEEETLRKWKGMGIRKIKRIFKFPNFANSGIPKKEKALIRRILRKQAMLVQVKLSRVSKFWFDFLDIYNAYKHGLTASLGFYAILEERKLISMFLVRRKCLVRGGERRICTYHVPVNPSTVDYLNQISTDIRRLLKLLIDSFLLFISNEEGFFILPVWRDELKLTEEEERFLDSIPKKLSFRPLPKSYKTELAIHGKRMEIMRRAFAKNYIYRNCRFDIFKMQPQYVIS